MKNSVLKIGIALLVIFALINYAGSREQDDRVQTTPEPSYTMSELQEVGRRNAEVGMTNADWKEFTDGYNEGCVEDDIRLVPYCRCTLQELESRNTREEIMTIALDFLEADENYVMHPELLNAAYACIEYFPEG